MNETTKISNKDKHPSTTNEVKEQWNLKNLHDWTDRWRENNLISSLILSFLFFISTNTFQTSYHSIFFMIWEWKFITLYDEKIQSRFQFIMLTRNLIFSIKIHLIIWQQLSITMNFFWKQNENLSRILSTMNHYDYKTQWIDNLMTILDDLIMVEE